MINQTIATEEYVLGSPTNTAVERFDIRGNREVRFLPKRIGEKLPNIYRFHVGRCGLTVIRSHYFANMKKLRYLNLYNNRIATIESDAFKDLISVERLWLDHNMIQALDQELFAAMISLEMIDLRFNEMKFLSPTTFRVSGGKLKSVDLTENDCIDILFDSASVENFDQIENDLKTHCSR